MLIYELLKKDHKEVKELFEEIEEALEGEDFDRVEPLFVEARDKLTAHSKAEAEIFYQPLKAVAEDNGSEIVWEGEEEHHLIALLLNELSRLNISDESWKAKFKVLTELVEHHVEEEEGEIFKTAKKYIKDDEAADMCEDMEKLKSTYMEMVESALEEDLAVFSLPYHVSSEGPFLNR
ncbi:hemerythrin domain-containing protein [Bdellovibrio sp. HCB2-146]|uniref:hemerythrin domain-containing protein n=1 Tax=Bdellovibrio sp. HCB2-146 TaxID=3394362 RepID=UPI0039BC794E